MRQSEFELETFKLFARNSRLKILKNSIENRDSPEPDVYCEVEDQGGVAFELTQLIDPQIKKKIDLQDKTKRVLTNYWKNKLSEGKSKLFRSKYSDALISFHFKNDLSERNREKSLPKVFDKLISQPDGFDGDMINYDQDFFPEIEKVRVQRGYQGEPRFHVNGFSWFHDPSVETLKKKFCKSYRTDYPIELLTHIDWDLSSPWGDDYWPQIIRNIEQDFNKSPFRKLWIYDTTKEVILYEYE